MVNPVFFRTPAIVLSPYGYFDPFRCISADPKKISHEGNYFCCTMSRTKGHYIFQVKDAEIGRVIIRCGANNESKVSRGQAFNQYRQR
jgi:hypothetical protein